MDKKVTRKQFILSALSITALFVASKIPSMVKNNFTPKKEGNNYGNYAYGGSKNNA